MAAEVLLPDTCAWIDFFNGRDTALANALGQALRECEIVICGVVIYELFQGVRSDKEGVMLREAISSLRYIEMDSALWISAAQLSASLRNRGVTIPLSDIIIASLAQHHKATVLTVDKHFFQIPGLVVKEVL